MAMMNCIAVIVISVSISISGLMISFPGAAVASAAAATPLLNPGIQKLCSATKNPKVCARSLNGPYFQEGQTRVDPTWALVMQAHAGINATERAIVKAKRAQLNDPSIAESIQVCLDSYDSVLDSWRNALTSLQQRNGFDVANHLTSVSAMTMSCEDAFSGDDPTVVANSPLNKIDRLIMKMGSNALTIQQMLFPGSN